MINDHMTAEARYFNNVTYKPQYQIGERVRGIWNKIPFTGSVAVDTMLDVDVGPYVMVFLDLPIKVDDAVHTIIRVNHSDMIDADGSFSRESKNKKSKKKV